MCEPAATPPATLSMSDRIAIVNALMAQDRTEIRDKQESVFRLTYYAVPGFIGIAAFSVGNPQLRDVLILAQVALLLLYVAAYLTFRKWLRNVRACLEVRESFYKHEGQLVAEPFTPLRAVDVHDRTASVRDHALWFPFVMGLACAALMLGYMIYSEGDGQARNQATTNVGIQSVSEQLSRVPLLQSH